MIAHESTVPQRSFGVAHAPHLYLPNDPTRRRDSKAQSSRPLRPQVGLRVSALTSAQSGESDTQSVPCTRHSTHMCTCFFDYSGTPRVHTQGTVHRESVTLSTSPTFWELVPLCPKTSRQSLDQLEVSLQHCAPIVYISMIVPLTGAPPVVTYTQYNIKQCNMKQYMTINKVQYEAIHTARSTTTAGTG